MYTFSTIYNVGAYNRSAFPCITVVEIMLTVTQNYSICSKNVHYSSDLRIHFVYALCCYVTRLYGTR